MALLAAATAGVVAQGGFYLPGRILVTALAVVAPALAGLHRPDRDLRRLGLAAAVIAVWALLRAVTAGGLWNAAGIVLALVTLLAGALAARRARAADLVTGLTALGALVALTAWAGVAWRIERWSVLVESTLWRGASTLTYPNAAAAILAATALLALAKLLAETPQRHPAETPQRHPAETPQRPAAVVRTLGLYVILAGLGATLSRAGVLAFGAGVLVFLLFAPIRQVLRHLAPTGLGALIAVAALVPSFPAGDAPAPLPAIGGLVAGGLIALVPLRWIWAPLGALAAAGVAIAATGSSTLDAVLDRRFTAASQGRAGALRSAVEQVREHPLLGSGPGRARYFWLDFQGQMVVSRWVHNEYLQWLVDLGVVGLIALLGLVAAVVVLVRRGYVRRPHPLWTGAVAAIAALAVHSAFDFLWELAVVPMLFGLLIGMTGSHRNKDGAHHSEESAPSTNGEDPQ